MTKLYQTHCLIRHLLCKSSRLKMCSVLTFILKNCFRHFKTNKKSCSKNENKNNKNYERSHLWTSWQHLSEISQCCNNNNHNSHNKMYTPGCSCLEALIYFDFCLLYNHICNNSNIFNKSHNNTTPGCCCWWYIGS